jgi:hypothetical protein
MSATIVLVTLARRQPSTGVSISNGYQVARIGACSLPMDRDMRCTTNTTDAPGEHAQQAWEHWRKLGAPKYLVAPMVDQVWQRCGSIVVFGVCGVCPYTAHKHGDG